jgi:molecular chaperone GrpE
VSSRDEPTIHDRSGDAGPVGAAHGTTAPPDDPQIHAERELQEARELAADLEDQLRRALADLDNLRKRYAREVVRERAAERTEVAGAWLPVVDDLERALQHAGADADALVEGVRAVHDQALTVLERLGFPRFDDVGRRFDPTRHEAVSAIESDEASPGNVIAAVRPGYGTDEEVLRPAGVVVARGSD